MLLIIELFQFQLLARRKKNVWIEIRYLNSVTSSLDVSTTNRLLIIIDPLVHIGWFRKTQVAFKHLRYPSRLHLGKCHDRTDWLHESNHCESERCRRTEYVLVQAKFVVVTNRQ